MRQPRVDPQEGRRRRPAGGPALGWVLGDEVPHPVAVAIAQLKGNYYQDYGLQLAATLVSVAPVMVLFLLLQRDFIAGLTAGAVKG